MMQSVKTRQMDKMQKSSICLCMIVVSAPFWLFFVYYNY